MKTQAGILRSFLHAAAVFVYVSCVAWLVFNGEKFLGHTNSFLTPLFVLLLFVVSASVTGLLVLGKPIHLYMTGLKQEAFLFLFATILWLVVFLSGLVVMLTLF